MSYSVKEIYYTLQGEGARAGRAAVLCRFAGCNLWSGREEDRARAICNFCDTDFVGTNGPGGGVFETAAALVAVLVRTWERGLIAEGDGLPDESSDIDARPYVVFTGGEPGLQMDAALVDACHEAGFEVAVETNGTVELPRGIDWVTVSPKPGPPLAVTRGQELKLVYPQSAVPPEIVAGLDFDLLYLQPMDGPNGEENTALATAYCLRHPRWRLSLQTHKLLGLR